jgi:hypothetical protein
VLAFLRSGREVLPIPAMLHYIKQHGSNFFVNAAEERAGSAGYHYSDNQEFAHLWFDPELGLSF